MNNLTLAKRAYKLFSHKDVDKHTLRYNVRAYCKAMEALGDKWILSNPVQRKH